MFAHFRPYMLPLIAKGTLVLLCMVAHELGHILTSRYFRVPVKRIGFNWLGMYIQRARTAGWPEVSICIAGAGMNLMLALVFWNISSWFALCNLTFGWVNLLPLPRSDGRHALEALRAMIAPANV
jgi:Zn-dependent protease